jgi:hypothetical protein
VFYDEIFGEVWHDALALFANDQHLLTSIERTA